MTSITPAQPLMRPRNQHPARRNASFPARAIRWTLALAFAATGVFIVVNEASMRTIESRMLALTVGSLFGEHTVANTASGQPAVTFATGDEWHALRITIQCSIALYLGPVFLLAGIIGLAPGVKLLRVALATIVSVVSLIILNQLRLLMIAFAFAEWGRSGYSWTHGPIGSILMLLGLAGVLAIFFLVCLRRKARK